MYVYIYICTYIRTYTYIHIRTYIQLNTYVAVYYYDVLMQHIQHVWSLLSFFFRSDCRHFGVDVPAFSIAEELQADITRFEKMWSLYDQFHTGLLEMTREDWISFRYILYTYNTYICVCMYLCVYVHMYV